HLGAAQDHDRGILAEVLRRGACAARAKLAHGQRIAQRLRPGATGGRSESHRLESGAVPLPATARPNCIVSRRLSLKPPSRWFNTKWGGALQRVPMMARRDGEASLVPSRAKCFRTPVEEFRTRCTYFAVLPFCWP